MRPAPALAVLVALSLLGCSSSSDENEPDPCAEAACHRSLDAQGRVSCWVGPPACGDRYVELCSAANFHKECGR